MADLIVGTIVAIILGAVCYNLYKKGKRAKENGGSFCGCGCDCGCDCKCDECDL